MSRQFSMSLDIFMQIIHLSVIHILTINHGDMHQSEKELLNTKSLAVRKDGMIDSWTIWIGFHSHIQLDFLCWCVDWDSTQFEFLENNLKFMEKRIFMFCCLFYKRGGHISKLFNNQCNGYKSSFKYQIFLYIILFTYWNVKTSYRSWKAQDDDQNWNFYYPSRS